MHPGDPRASHVVQRILRHASIARVGHPNRHARLAALADVAGARFAQQRVEVGLFVEFQGEVGRTVSFLVPVTGQRHHVRRHEVAFAVFQVDRRQRLVGCEVHGVEPPTVDGVAPKHGGAFMVPTEFADGGPSRAGQFAGQLSFKRQGFFSQGDHGQAHEVFHHLGPRRGSVLGSDKDRDEERHGQRSARARHVQETGQVHVRKIQKGRSAHQFRRRRRLGSRYSRGELSSLFLTAKSGVKCQRPFLHSSPS